MGRKNRGKGNKLAKKNFRKTFCDKCSLCSGEDTSFCYNTLYQHDPKAFSSVIHPKLIQNYRFLRENIMSDVMGGADLVVGIFQAIFCKSGICQCGRRRDDAVECLLAFRHQGSNWPSKSISQIKALANDKKNPSGKTKKLTKAQKKKISPVISLIMSNDVDFQNEVNRILGNTVKQPDNIDKPTGDAQEHSDRAIDTQKSEA